MPEHSLPDSVRQLILAKIPSVWQLEILLQLYAARPEFQTVRNLEKALRLDAEPLLEQLESLHAHGLAFKTTAPELAFAYAGVSAEQDQAVADLVEAYRTRQVSVISLIHSRPTEKIRTFADAFRLRQDKESSP